MQWQSIFGNGNDEKPILVQEWLKKRRINKDAFELHPVDERRVQSTEKFLEDRGIDKTAVVSDEIARAETRHRHFGRTIVLLSLVVPMSIAPFWLMALLSLPAFNRKVYSEGMQAALLAALASDFVGLYYVITRDLFPQGSNLSRKKHRVEADDED